MRLVDELDDLHTSYVRMVNDAIADGDRTRAERLAEMYDDEAVRLVAEREGRTDLLPLVGRRPATRLRRLVARLRFTRAA